MVRRIEDPRQNSLGLNEPLRTFTPPAGWAVQESFPELEGIVAIDLETKDIGITNGVGPCWPHRGEGFICGVAICWRRSKFYVPLMHAAGNLDPDRHHRFWVWLKEQAEKPDVTFVMANAVYDTGWLRRLSIVPHNPPIDVQVMAFLLDEHRMSYSLSSLSKHYLHRDKGTLTLFDMAKSLHIKHPMSNMDKLPAWIVEPYALDDVDLTYCLYYDLIPKIAAEKLGEPLRLESECTMVSVDMRWEGVRVDQRRLELLGAQFALKVERALAQIIDLTGIRVEPFDNGEAMKALRAENSAVQFGITEKGRDSVDRFALQAIGSPVAMAILEARKYEKARGTFVESLGHYIRNGRIHAEFHSTRNNSSNNDDMFGDDSMYGATSGRWASSHPNLQNIPARDDVIGPAVRSCFIPEDGERWLKLDYASQEPRLTVHFASMATINGNRLTGAAEMVERFQKNPMTDLHGECAALMGVSRAQAKTINLALAYGMQGGALCKSLGLPTKTMTMFNGNEIEVAGDEGEILLRKHFNAVPFVRQLFDLAKHTAKSRGYVKTITGQKIRFERYADGKFARVHKALNGVIQGSAAGQMKMALVALRRENMPVNLTVHDEADCSVPMGEAGEILIDRMTTIMEEVIKIAVPMVAEAKTGPSWGECK